MEKNEESTSGGPMYPFVVMEDQVSKPQEEEPFNSGGQLYTPGLNPESEPMQVVIKISPKTE